MNMNLKINSTYQNILNTITEAELPVGIVYFMLKDIMNEVDAAYQASIQLELQQKLEQGLNTEETVEEKTQEEE